MGTHTASTAAVACVHSSFLKLLSSCAVCLPLVFPPPHFCLQRKVGASCRVPTLCSPNSDSQCSSAPVFLFTFNSSDTSPKPSSAAGGTPHKAGRT